MGLEADDGRPETSPPPRRGVQTADRAVVRERQAIPGDRGRVRHRAIDPAALGPRHPRPAVGDGGGRFRTSGAGIHTKAGVIRANAARYRRDAGCWASPIHLLLDDRASRDGACGSDRRRRARGPARQPRTLRRQEDQGRLGKEGRHRVQEAHRRHHARTGHDERADDSNRTGRGSTRRSSRTCWTASSTATPRTRIWRAILPMSASADRLLKKELVYRNHYTTIEQPRHDPDDCVWWSDAQRLHSALGYRSPKEFTEQGLVL